MYSSRVTTSSTSVCWDNIARFRQELDAADAVVIGAGAGLSTSAGFTYTGEQFERSFSDFIQNYGFHDMYSGGFYPFDTLEEIGADTSASTAIWTRQSRFTAIF